MTQLKSHMTQDPPLKNNDKFNVTVPPGYCYKLRTV